jgi:hypothetical protein
VICPDVEVVCASSSLELDEYVHGIGDPRRVVDMLVGDTQRIGMYAERESAVSQEVIAVSSHGGWSP